MNKYQNILEFWLNEFVGDKELYNIEINEERNNITINVYVKKEYIGRIIGKNGNIITSIRNLINSISKKDKKNAKIIIKDI